MVTIASDFTPYDNTNAIKCKSKEDWVREIEKWLDADPSEYLKEARGIIDKDFPHKKEALETTWDEIFAVI